MGQLDRESMYNGFSVGYFGDYAGVSCHLVTPRHTLSSCPDGKMRRKDFDVVTTSDQFNLESIGHQIDNAEDIGLSAETVDFLVGARAALQQFVDQNGSTNPYEAVDWEMSAQPA